MLGAVDFRFVDGADERSASQERAKVPFLVAKHRDIHADALQRGILANCTRSFQRVDHAKGTVQPAGVILGFDM